MTESEGRCLAVLGMHRSATSALTRMLAHLSAPLPRAADLGRGRTVNPYNRLGFWEPRLLVLENEHLLNRAGGSWSAPPPLSDRSIYGIESQHTSYEKLLVRYHAREPIWVWKDPRLCLTLGHWIRLLGETHAILMFRHPAAVASSLARRDGFGLELGYALWELYVISALQRAHGLPALVIFQEDLFINTREMMDEIVKWMADLGISLRPEGEAGKMGIEPGLAHVPLTPNLPGEIQSLWELVKSLDRRSADFVTPRSLEVSEHSRTIIESRRQREANTRSSEYVVKAAKAWGVELLRRMTGRASSRLDPSRSGRNN